MAARSDGLGGERGWSHPAEDLSNEWALKSCPRTEFEGRKRPTLGRIALLAKLGKGGMGVVYYGVNPRLGTEVAVKVLPREMQEKEEQATDRFVREARIAAQLSSDHLVSVLDVDQDDSSGAHYLVMEYVRGVTAGRWMKDLVAKKERVPESAALDVCIAATKGLAAAHVEGILHRDLKPENILIPADADRRLLFERAKLADLGLARPETNEDGLTMSEVGMGTPGFMAPEQARDAASARKPADVFGMGATLYTLLAGEPPFRGATAVDTLLRTMKGEHRAIRAIRPDVSAPTAALLQRCLAPQPERRFPDAPALLDALEVCRAALADAAVAGESVSRIDAIAVREESGKRVISHPAAPANPAAAAKRREARRRAANAAHNRSSAPWMVGGLLVVTALLALAVISGNDSAKPAPPPPRAASAPAAEAGLDVTTEPPGATVVVDGTNRGRAPLFVRSLAYGKHDVRIDLPSHTSRTTTIVIRAGEKTQLHVPLSRAVNSIHIEGGAPGAKVSLVRAGDPPKAYDCALDDLGGLDLRNVEAGEYTVRVTCPGFDPVERRNVFVPADGPGTSLSAQMREHPGSLSVKSEPPGAEVWIDGRNAGVTPLAGLSVAAGVRRVELRHPQFKTETKDVPVRGDQPRDLGTIVLAAFAALDVGGLDSDVVVKLNGAPVTSGAKVPPGKISVVLERPFHAPQTVPVEAQPGGAAVVRAEPWEKFQARVDLSALPEGTRVFVDGEERDRRTVGWPASRKVRLVLVRAGYDSVTIDVDVALGSPHRLETVKWVELRTQVDLADLAFGVTIDGRPYKEGAVLAPGPHFWGAKAAKGAAFQVTTQRWVRPPLYDNEKSSTRPALDWLARHQWKDGRWSSDGFDRVCAGNKCSGPGDAGLDVGLTGLALSAFLCAGETQSSGPHSDVVAKALKFLRQVQDGDGGFAPRKAPAFQTQNAIAALAVIDAFRYTGDPELREPAQRAAGFVLKSKNPYLAWRYDFPPDGDNDTEVTIWMVRALNAALRAGLDAERSAMTDAMAWVDKMTEPEFGRTGYQQRGGPSGRSGYQNAGGPMNHGAELQRMFPADKSECLTAGAVLVRFWAGRTPKDDEFIVKGLDLCVRKLPAWNEDSGAIDFCYWHFGTLATARLGGEHWKRWRDAAVVALVNHQRVEPDRDERGSWDPEDVWSGAGGRVYATAINCLTVTCLGR